MSTLGTIAIRCGLWALEAASIALAVVVATGLRFDFQISFPVAALLPSAVAVALATKIPLRYLAGLHLRSWRYFGVADGVYFGLANLVGAGLFGSIGFLWLGPEFPRSVYVIDGVILLLIDGAMRLGVRYYLDFGIRRRSGSAKSGRRRAAVYGAGAAGQSLLRELRVNPSLGYDVVALFDDDVRKAGTRLVGVPVVGVGRDIPRFAARARRRGRPLSEIIIAMPSATGQQMREAIANCRAAEIACRTIPGTAEVLSGKFLSQQLREVSVLDVLGRDPVRLEEDRISQSISDRVVMVTGGGGSIGSEICRQVLRHRPRRLVVFENNEYALYRIDTQLRRLHPDAEIAAVVGDVRDAARVTEVIRRDRVTSIFHAAAYKHVPIMEAHLLEAIQTNIFGTANLMAAACRLNVDRFLMISSDKAVRPTSVMGLTKRIAELVVAAYHAEQRSGVHATTAVSVRFGNVLDSSGSVVPLFREQIASGGPVTVTHPDMKRYFMTIPEAVQLVLQAGTMGSGLEVFVLDMGEPVKIVSLAENMIRLSGCDPNKIDIEFVGLRPGEKLYEELYLDDENLRKTHHERILILNSPLGSPQELLSVVAGLRECVRRRDEEGAVALMSNLVEEYQPSDRWAGAVLSGRTAAPETRPTAQAV